MNVDFETTVRKIAELENRNCGNKFKLDSLEALRKDSLKDDVGDSPAIYRIDGLNSEDDAIITVSNPQFPDFVQQAVDKVNEVAATLESGLSGPVLCPSISACYETQSYAFWPRRMPISENRILKRLQIGGLFENAFNWLCEVARTTQSPVDTEQALKTQYLEPLDFLLAEQSIPTSTKKLAEAAREAIAQKEFLPVCILQHGDFWYGNLLLARAWPISRHSFYIIDWGGADMNGYPYVDALRYLMSARQSDSRMSACLRRYRGHGELAGNGIVHYVCAYAGFLGMNRNEFPLDRYLKMIDTLIATAVRMQSCLNPEFTR